MLVLLKIPLVYLCMVVWWAIRAEPRDEQPPTAVRVTGHPGLALRMVAAAPGPPTRRRPPRPPHAGRSPTAPRAR